MVHDWTVERKVVSVIVQQSLQPKQLVTLHPSSLLKNLVSDWKWMWFFFITIDKNPNISPSCHHCLIIINAISLLHYLYVLLKNVSCSGKKNFFGIHANLLRSWAQYSVILSGGTEKGSHKFIATSRYKCWERRSALWGDVRGTWTSV